MQPTQRQSESKPAISKPVDVEVPDIASASVPDTLAALRVDADAGLSRAEVDVRRKESGYNEVAATKAHPIPAFLRGQIPNAPRSGAGQHRRRWHWGAGSRRPNDVLARGHSDGARP